MRRITNRKRAPDTSFLHTRITVPRYCCKGETQVVYISSLSIQILKSNVFIVGNCVSKHAGCQRNATWRRPSFLVDVPPRMCTNARASAWPWRHVPSPQSRWSEEPYCRSNYTTNHAPHEVRPLRNTPPLSDLTWMSHASYKTRPYICPALRWSRKLSGWTNEDQIKMLLMDAIWTWGIGEALVVVRANHGTKIQLHLMFLKYTKLNFIPVNLFLFFFTVFEIWFGILFSQQNSRLTIQHLFKSNYWVELTTVTLWMSPRHLQHIQQHY